MIAVFHLMSHLQKEKIIETGGKLGVAGSRKEMGLGSDCSIDVLFTFHSKKCARDHTGECVNCECI